MPGGPTSVTSRALGRASSASICAISCSRPISAVRCSGRCSTAGGLAGGPSGGSSGGALVPPREAHKGRALVGWHGQRLREQAGHLARGAARTGLDFLNSVGRTVGAFGKVELAEIQAFAPPAKPVA